MKIAIICPQGLPVPAVKGGAIETLVEIISKENEIYRELDIDIYSIYDDEAIGAAKSYRSSKFIYLCKNKKYMILKNKLVSLCRRIFKININYAYSDEIIKNIDNSYNKVIIEGDASLILPISKKISKEKLYFHIHHNPLSTNHAEFKKEIINVNKIITVSNFISNGINKCMSHEKENVQAVVLKNCTDVKKFNVNNYKQERNKLRDRYNIKDNEVVIMFTGRPIPQKGIKELLVAFKELCNKYNNIKLIIVGNSGFGKEVKTKFDNELEEIAKEIKDKVIFTGFIHNNNMPQIHAIADISVIPSIYDDPAPLVVIECMASGLAVITTDSGGIPEYVGENNCISIIRDENIIINLKKELEKLIINEEYRKVLGENAHNYAQQFNSKNFYYDFIDLIKD